ncbi:hypothetical protein M440DRAFT_141515 [Trichoderma longibrachiatum ATCC 18648]|uniref:Uncharacterized protein n=1 Tax=Trichoderma longibrachiatum ATCC 18648 TaxID=983965 RepID=A0A2T4BUU3_TRILO|nr:hypothetical protein M440DRAFT_141515 [Trichoderma longibrachiatum ATCC 18648]
MVVSRCESVPLGPLARTKRMASLAVLVACAVLAGKGYMYSRHHLPTHTRPRGSKRNGEAGRGEMQASRPRLWERRRENVAEQTREADTVERKRMGSDKERREHV